MTPAKKRRVVLTQDQNAEMIMETATAKDATTIMNTNNDKDDDSTTTTNNNNNKAVMDNLYEQHKVAMETLLSNITDLTNNNNNPHDGTTHDGTTHDKQQRQSILLASSLASLTALKSIQRQISLRTSTHHTRASYLQRQRVEESSLMLENLNYEIKYLRGEIGECRRWRGVELERLAREELLGIDNAAAASAYCMDDNDGCIVDDGTGLDSGDDGNENDGNDDDDDDDDAMEQDRDAVMKRKRGSTKFKNKPKITTMEQVIDAYLLPNNNNNNNNNNTSTTSTTTSTAFSHRDTQNHAHILQKLQTNLSTRSSLVAQLSQSKLILMELKKKKEELQGYLKSVPKKLQELERVGEELNGFFGNGSHTIMNNDDVVVAVGVVEDGGITKNTTTTTAAGATTSATTTTSGIKRKVEEQLQAANLLVNRPSTNRMQRFQMAQSKLPSPLYVLFVQLVGYMDAWSSLELLKEEGSSIGGSTCNNALGGFVGASGMDVVAVPPPASGGNDGKEGMEEDNDDNHTKGWNVVLSLSSSNILPSEITCLSGKSSSSGGGGGGTGARSSTIKIVFSYDANQGVVLASVEGEERRSSGKGEEDGLLDNLFPGDDGSVNPNLSLDLLKGDECDDSMAENDGDERSSSKLSSGTHNGKPYYWCQVLAGLSFPPLSSSFNTHKVKNDTEGSIPCTSSSDPPFQIQICTKAVLRQILRRIRARRTLGILLDTLGKRSQINPLPIHPAMKGGNDATSSSNGAVSTPTTVVKAKLLSWTEDSKFGKGRHEEAPSSSSSSSVKRYVATIKRKTATLKAYVLVDMQNYPAEPPVWSLQNEDGTSGTHSSWGERHGTISSLQNPNANTNASTNSSIHNSPGNGNHPPPLFDATLHRIECHVNSDLEKFVRQDVETTFDWILIHQLADIVSCWDEVMSVGEGGSASVSGSGSGNSSSRGKSGEFGGMMGYQRRLRKGKDRRLVGFGERSPFYLYRNGL